MQVVVVEGKNDANRVKSLFPDIEIIITNGIQFPTYLIDYLLTLSQTHEIIIFTDPDYAGGQIRSKLAEKIKNVSHAFISHHDAKSSNGEKMGIEHANNEVIKHALANRLKGTKASEGTITSFDLLELGLTGNSLATQLRDKVSNKLQIGKPNAKQFLKRVNLLGLKKEELIDVIKTSN